MVSDRPEVAVVATTNDSTLAAGVASSADVAHVAQILEHRYGAWPDESESPVIDQLVWFLLSTRTTVENCEAAYQAMCRRFDSWDEVLAISEEKLYPLLRPAGLYRARAKNLRAALCTIEARFGEVSLEALRHWPDDECELFLLSLAGVGLKVARCIMSFGLRRKVFAVDTHIWRVSKRLGWHDFPGDAPSPRGANHLNALVVGSTLSARRECTPQRPDHVESLRLFRSAVDHNLRADFDITSLHVNLIRLGRESCLPDAPRCEECPLAELCPKKWL